MKGRNQTAAGAFVLLGNRLCVDFANTVYSRHGDGLRSWQDVADFLVASGAAPAKPALLPPQQKQVLEHALRLRVALRQALAAIAGGQAIRPLWVAPLNLLLRARPGMEQLAMERGGWRLEFRALSRSPLAVLHPIARSAAELIAEGPAAPLRKCANPKCLLFFYDTSGKGRRWCSMQMCGNRAKVAAYVRRKRR